MFDPRLGLASPAVLPVETPRHLAEAALQAFERLDADGDGHLTKSELQLTQQRASSRGAEAAMIVSLVEGGGSLASLVREDDGIAGITRQDLHALANRSGAEPSIKAERVFAKATVRLAEGQQDLFPDGLASIRPEAIRQGVMGDCYLLSALTCLAVHRPEKIRSMIKPHADGSYTVNLGGKPITVAPLTDVDRARFASTRHGTWVAVIEKAYAQFDPSVNAGGLTKGIEALTGSRTRKDVVKAPIMGLDRLRQHLALATGAGKAVVASRTWTFAGDKRPGHVYAILAYDRAKDLIVIRDPFGDGGKADDEGDGVFVLTPDEFAAQFDLMGTER